MRRSLSIALLLFVGCDDGVDIIGHCEATSDAVLVLAESERVEYPALGVLDDHVLLQWGQDSADLPNTQFAVWLDASLSESSERFDLGLGSSYGSVWVRDGDALRGQLWADPEHDLPLVAREMVHLWRLTRPPDATAEFEQVFLDVHDAPDGFAEIGLGSTRSPGLRGVLPAVMSDRGFTAGVIAIPPSCELLGNYDTLYAFGSAHAEPTAVTWLDTPCIEPALEHPGTGMPWFVDLGDEIGVIARIAQGNELHLIRIRPDGAVTRPRRVGSNSDRDWCSSNSGSLPRGVALPGGKILFAECAQRDDRGRECHRLRIADRDGTDAHDAPWQLPCIENEARTSLSLELVAIEGGAVVVWGERDAWEGWVELPSGTELQQRVRAAIITPDGDRGSEIVTVTDAGATAFTGPFALDFLIAAAADGERAVVGWQDARPSAPGFYVRTLRCTVDP